MERACGRAHDMMGVHMTQHFEVNHRRTQLTEVNIALQQDIFI